MHSCTSSIGKIKQKELVKRPLLVNFTDLMNAYRVNALPNSESTIHSFITHGSGSVSGSGFALLFLSLCFGLHPALALALASKKLAAVEY